MKLNTIRQNVWKCGNALVITIPTTIAEMFGISEGDIIKFLPEKLEPLKFSTKDTQEMISKPISIREKSKFSEVKRKFLQKLEKHGVKPIRGKNSVFDVGNECRIYLNYSKKYTPGTPYWFGLDSKVIQEYGNEINKRFYIVLLAGNENNAYIFPLNDMKVWLTGVPQAKDKNWKITYTSNLKLRLTGKEPIDISKYLNTFKLFNINIETP